MLGYWGRHSFLLIWSCELGVVVTTTPFSSRRKRGQRERQNARAILALERARGVLARHHGGGSMAPVAAGGRHGRPKPGMWMCRCGGQVPLGTRACPFCARVPPVRVTQPPTPSVRTAIPPSGPQTAGERKPPQRGAGAAASYWKQATAAAPPWKQRERDEFERKLRELRDENKRLAALQVAKAEDAPGAEAADPMADYNRKRSKLAASESSLRETLGEEHAAVKAVRAEIEELERQKPPLSKRSAERRATTLARKLARIEEEAAEAERAAEEQRTKHAALTAQAAELREEIRTFELQHGRVAVANVEGGRAGGAAGTRLHTRRHGESARQGQVPAARLPHRRTASSHQRHSDGRR